MGLLRSLFSLFTHQDNYGTECRTMQGEKVKSKAEKIIADYFHRNNIKYEYEKIAKTHAWLFSKKISRPDFYLPEYKIYVEYWGLIDVEKRRVKSKYLRIMKWKMAQYHKNKINFISIYPQNLKNFDWIFRTKFKEAMGFNISTRN